jgi:serine/threonine protein kinase
MKLPEPPSAALSEELPDSAIASAARALPAGARLDQFEIEAVIGAGSVVIVYAATDRALAVPVAIAEYMPAQLAWRNTEARVAPRTAAHAAALALGLQAFIQDTRTLARCDHPSLVRVVGEFEANATAYRVMPRYPTGRLLDVRVGMNEPPDEEGMRALLDALLGALQAFHDAGGVHGRVTPANIVLLSDDRPLLLGPGGAGRAIARDGIDPLLTSAEPCFAPIEQIVEADRPLRPSVDLYALAGVARYWMSGQLPLPALGAPGTARRETLAETIQRLRLSWPGLPYSASLLDALDRALSIYPAERPQSAAEMRVLLEAGPAGEESAASVPSTVGAVLHDALASAPAQTPEPAPAAVPPEVEPALASLPDPDAATTRVYVDADPVLRTPFAPRARGARRIAMGSTVLLVLLALLWIGVREFVPEEQVGRWLDALGISRGTADRVAAGASTPGPAAPASAPLAADSGAANSAPTEATAADSSPRTTTPESPATAAVATDAGTGKATPTEPPTAQSATSASTAPSPPPIAADAESAQPMATEPAVAPPAPAATPALPAPVAGAPLTAQLPATPPATRRAQAPATHAPASPREACGTRTQFALYRCMQTQCSQQRWAAHAQCERLRRTDSVD